MTANYLEIMERGQDLSASASFFHQPVPGVGIIRKWLAVARYRINDDTRAKPFQLVDRGSKDHSFILPSAYKPLNSTHANNEALLTDEDAIKVLRRMDDLNLLWWVTEQTPKYDLLRIASNVVFSGGEFVNENGRYFAPVWSYNSGDLPQEIESMEGQDLYVGWAHETVLWPLIVYLIQTCHQSGIAYFNEASEAERMIEDAEGELAWQKKHDPIEMQNASKEILKRLRQEDPAQPWFLQMEEDLYKAPIDPGHVLATTRWPNKKVKAHAHHLVDVCKRLSEISSEFYMRDSGRAVGSLLEESDYGNTYGDLCMICWGVNDSLVLDNMHEGRNVMASETTPLYWYVERKVEPDGRIMETTTKHLFIEMAWKRTQLSTTLSALRSLLRK